MTDQLRKYFTKVNGAAKASEYETTYSGISLERDDSRDDKIAFLTAYSTIATQGTLFGALNADITVAGGPLANNISETGDSWPWGEKEGNKYIPAGTPVEEILTKLFLKVIDGTVSLNYTNWNPSVGAPTATINKTGSVEVGTTTTVSYTGNTTLSNNSMSVQLTANQGYFKDNDATWKPAVTSSTVETKTGTQKGEPILVGKWNNVDINSGDKVTIGDGTNTLSVSESGVIAYFPDNTVDFTNSVYYASNNVKKRLDVTATVEDKTVSEKPLTSSKSSTVTGVRYYFISTLDSTLIGAPTSAIIRNNVFKTDAKTTGTIKAGFTNMFKTLIVALPGNQTLKQCYATSTSGSIDYVSKMTKTTISVEGLNGYTGTNYTVYYYPTETAFGGEEFTFVIQ